MSFAGFLSLFRVLNLISLFFGLVVGQKQMDMGNMIWEIVRKFKWTKL